MPSTIFRPDEYNNSGTAYESLVPLINAQIRRDFPVFLNMQGLTDTVEITSGYQETFNFMGNLKAVRISPGADVLADGQLSSANCNKKTISLDDPLYCGLLYDDELHARQQTDYAMDLSSTMANEIAAKCDSQLMQVGINGARAAAIVSNQASGSGYRDQYAGSVVHATTALTDTTGAAIRAAIVSAATIARKHNLRLEEMMVLLNSDAAGILHNATGMYNSVWNSPDFQTRKLLSVSGLKVDEAPHFPSTVVTAATSGEYNTYAGDFTKTFGLVFHKKAIAFLQRGKITYTDDWIPNRNGHLMQTTLSCGMDWLRPDCLIELTTAAAA